MSVRSLLIVLALVLVAGAAYAQDSTICVPAPGTTTTTTSTEMGTTTTVAVTPEVESYNINFVSSTYGISPATVRDLRTKHDWGTIYFMANVAAKTGRPITEIASLAEQGMTWNQIASRYNVAMSDLLVPGPRTAVAGYVGEIGTRPVTTTWMADKYGNIVLTQNEADRLRKQGYSWQDIAIAANVSSRTGQPVYQVLQWTDRGMTWPQIAREYGLNPDDVTDISMYPFDRSGSDSRYLGGMEIQTGPVGAGPMMQPEGTMVVPVTPENTPASPDTMTTPSTTPSY